MPKIKTHRGTAKRFSVTNNGKVKRASGNNNHMTGKRSGASKRRLAQTLLVEGQYAKNIKKLMPYD